MQLVRYESADGQVGYGLLEGDRIREIYGSIYGSFKVGTRGCDREQVKLLPPVQPTKIVAVGRNYAEHAAELGNAVPPEPLIFIKPATAVIGPEQPIIVPTGVGRVDYEGELAVVIRRKARYVSEKDAAQVILGYTCLNDVTARELQQKDKQFTRAKGFDTFCPIGPWLVTGISPLNRRIRTYVNGEVKQDGDTRDMVHGVWALIAFISRIMTLLPGDVVATGTPKGVGPIVPGDRVEVEIEGIGVLSNPVVAEESRPWSAQDEPEDEGSSAQGR
jgi:2-keto-4-pentenoate hydratase/2-oxohepta-3-ene-1,7-dioic acid hydratase in catechol pathway